MVCGRIASAPSTSSFFSFVGALDAHVAHQRALVHAERDHDARRASGVTSASTWSKKPMRVDRRGCPRRARPGRTAAPAASGGGRGWRPPRRGRCRRSGRSLTGRLRRRAALGAQRERLRVAGAAARHAERHTTASSHAPGRPRAPVPPPPHPTPRRGAGAHGRRLDAAARRSGGASAPWRRASRSLCVATTSVEPLLRVQLEQQLAAPARRWPGRGSRWARRRAAAAAAASRPARPPPAAARRPTARPGRWSQPRRRARRARAAPRRAPRTAARRLARDQRRQHDVLERGEVGRAGDGTGRRTRPRGCGSAASSASERGEDVDAVEAARWPPVGGSRHAEEMQQRALADARLADDRDALARARRRGRDPRSTSHHRRAVDVALLEAPRLHERRHPRRHAAATHTGSPRPEPGSRPAGPATAPRRTQMAIETSATTRKFIGIDPHRAAWSPGRRPSAARRTGSARGASSRRARGRCPRIVPATPITAPFRTKMRPIAALGRAHRLEDRDVAALLLHHHGERWPGC